MSSQYWLRKLNNIELLLKGNNVNLALNEISILKQVIKSEPELNSIEGFTISKKLKKDVD